ncbi:hypothetical protein [Streptococcus oralis]|uniref:Uncharacterized protein n=1 Tax=Streptococcus oralis TaxID=1303 RepID=A0A139QR71_STROR|nr:hypothetical protein [Streptococcus oralis]KXU05028.1 hypothetical protein SORDD24_00955 [Streptococcus oralis]
MRDKRAILRRAEELRTKVYLKAMPSFDELINSDQEFEDSPISLKLKDILKQLKVNTEELE